MFKTTGFISFFLRRLTGVALVLYLGLHIIAIGSVNLGPEAFNNTMNFLQSDLFKLAEIALLAAVVYHAFDGLRLIIVHYFDVTSYRKSLFYAAFAAAALLTVAGGIPILLFMLEG
ncbi:MAG: succinate dehydrogenase, cytochrome b556 subunit [Anaerolineae bacterium]|nr:succinate dehydrogenase, cytochrome b556 subunit [Anaerolineae bacterium]